MTGSARFQVCLYKIQWMKNQPISSIPQHRPPVRWSETMKIEEGGTGEENEK